MTLALTAYPSSANGTSSGKSSTSPGNIFLATYSESNAYQRWRFIDESGSIVYYPYSDTALNGIYYINNTETGKYLHKNQALSTPDAASGLISNLGNTIRWKITHLGEGEYVIQPVDDLTKYLKTISSTGTWVIYGTLSETEDIPNEYRWKFRFLRFQNVSSSMYLYVYTNTLGEYSVGVTSNTSKAVEWRIIGTERYGNSEDYPKRELPYNFEIPHIAAEYDTWVSPQIADNHNNNILWASSTDFIYSYTDYHNPYYEMGYAVIDNTVSKIYAQRYGSITIKATHKVTSLETTFEIRVLPCGGMYDFDTISNHRYELEADGYFQCTKCKYKIKSPPLQDQDILSDDDLLKVYALNIATTLLYKYCEEGMYGYYGANAYKVPLRMIDEIRQKNEYSTRYRYSEENGTCCPMFNGIYMASDLDRDYIQQKCNLYKSISIIKAAELNGVFEDLIVLVAGILIPTELSAAILNSITFDPTEPGACLDVLDMMSDMLPEKINVCVSALLGIKNISSWIGGNYSSGDTVVEIIVVSSTTIQFKVTVAFDSSGNLKNVTCEAGI